jgi:hypothetical protein
MWRETATWRVGIEHVWLRGTRGKVVQEIYSPHACGVQPCVAPNSVLLSTSSLLTTGGQQCLVRAGPATFLHGSWIGAGGGGGVALRLPSKESLSLSSGGRG